MVIVASGLSKATRMQIGEVILTPDAQQLAISSRFMEVQLLENRAGNQL